MYNIEKGNKSIMLEKTTQKGDYTTIGRYLSGEMSQEEIVAYEIQMSQDEMLAATVSYFRGLQKEAVHIIESTEPYLRKNPVNVRGRSNQK